MNIKLKAILFLLFLVLFSAESPYAQDQDHPSFALGARVSLSGIGNSTFDNTDAFFDESANFGISFSYLITENISIELDTNMARTDFDVAVDSRSESFGTLEQIGVLLTGIYYPQIDMQNVKLYIGVGAGYYFNDIEQNRGKDDPPADFFALNRTVTEVDDSFGAHFNVGAEYVLNRHYSLVTDFKFTFTKVSIDLEYPDSTTTETDLALNTVLLGLGIKYYF